MAKKLTVLVPVTPAFCAAVDRQYRRLVMSRVCNGPSAEEDADIEAMGEFAAAYRRAAPASGAGVAMTKSPKS
jgi:hypothetical protein